MAVPPLKVQSTTPQFYAQIQDQRTIPTQRLIPYALALPVIKDKPIRRWGNCVWTVRMAGYYVPKSRTGWAGSISVNSKYLSEGKIAVAVTYEGPYGHVLVVKKIDGQLVSIVEGNHSEGAGRIVDPSIVKGYI